jgi:hypothetical protein
MDTHVGIYRVRETTPEDPPSQEAIRYSSPVEYMLKVQISVSHGRGLVTLYGSFSVKYYMRSRC